MSGDIIVLPAAPAFCGALLLQQPNPLEWSSLTVGSGRLLRIEASAWLATIGQRLVRVAIEIVAPVAVSIAYAYPAGTQGLFWISGQTAGARQQFIVSLVADDGDTTTIPTFVSIQPLPALLPTPAPMYAPGAAVFAGNVILQDQTGAQPLILG